MCRVGHAITASGSLNMNVTTASRLRRSGKVLAIALPVMGIAGLSTLVMLPNQSSAQQEDPQRLDQIAPRSMIVGGELAALGITPESLAAAGVSSTNAASIVRALNINSDFGVDRFRAAREQHVEAQRDFDQLAQKIRSGRGRGSDAIECEAKRVHMELCENTCVVASDHALRIVEGVVSQDEWRRLHAVRANIDAGVPVPYAARALGDADRIRLRNALTARRVAERDERELDRSHAALLSAVESDPDVIAAQHGLMDVGFIRNAFELALSQCDD